MDFNIEDKQEIEIEKLKYYYQICNDALSDFSANHPYQLAAFEKDNIAKVLDRLFNGEIDYLIQSPECYFELYEED